MGRNRFSALVLACIALASPSMLGAQTTDLDIVTYDLALRLDLERRGMRVPLNTLSATARITFENARGEPVERVPVVLHRLLRIEAVRTGDGRSLDFTQRLAAIEDWESYQANVGSVILHDRLPPGDVLTLEIDYTGGMTGVRESGMLYVQESLDPDFTIIRPESASYPLLAEPTRESLRLSFGGGDGFDQVLEVTVPEGHVVASGRELAGKHTADGWTTWSYQGGEPNSQIILPVAPYEVIDVGAVQIYHFPEDREGAQRVAQGITEAMALFEDWFGVLHDQSSFALIEIPERYGSQAVRPTILQTATAFKDASGMPQLYHELSHLWNVADPAPTTASRWNEGLATYLQDVTHQSLDGDTASLPALWDRRREWFRKRLEENPEYRNVPLIEAGERGLTSALSYGGGGLMFALLDRRLGRERLISILGDFYQTYYESGATSEEFADFITAREPDTRTIIDEWFLGGTYSGLLLDGMDFEALAQRYEVE